MDLAPAFSTSLAPPLVGELLVHLPPGATLEGVLDSAGMSQTTVVPDVVAPFVGVPFHAQFGSVGPVAGSVLVSNGLVHRFE